jgi:hypothetical protein
MQRLLKGVGGENDNPIRIDRDKDEKRDTQTKTLLCNPMGCVCKTYLTFTLALKQRCKLIIFTPHKE